MYMPCIDDFVVGENEDAILSEGKDLSVFPLESETDMERSSTPLPLEEVPAPENTIDIQSDDHLQVPSMFLVSFHCIRYKCVYVCAYVAATVSSVKLPGKIPKHGRPKGSELTVIGIPKKKKLADGPVAFLKQHPKDQERGSYNYINSYSYIYNIQSNLL